MPSGPAERQGKDRKKSGSTGGVVIARDEDRDVVVVPGYNEKKQAEARTVPPKRRNGTRPRGAGRPAARKRRTASRAGPDDDSGESPEPPRPGACPNQRVEAVGHPCPEREGW
jgi:hypothetical protein